MTENINKNFCIGLQCYNSTDYEENNNKLFIKKTNTIIEKDIINDCPNIGVYPTIIPHKERIIAIGDIHGDMELAINFLKTAKVIQEVNVQQLLEKSKNLIIEEHQKKIQVS